MKKIKFRWYEIESSLSFKEIINKIKEFRYNETVDRGFEACEIKRDFADFKFIEKRESRDIQEDPFGREIVNLYVTYSIFHVSFEKINNNKIIMRTTNAPVSLKNFIDVLNQATLYKFSIVKLRLNLNNLYDWINDNKKIKRFFITKASAKNIEISNSAFACCDFSSNENALLDLREFLANRKYILDRLCVNFRINNSAAQIEAAESGSVALTENAQEILTEYIFSRSNKI